MSIRLFVGILAVLTVLAAGLFAYNAYECRMPSYDVQICEFKYEFLNDIGKIFN